MGLENDKRKKEGLLVERKPLTNEIKLQLSSEFLNENDAITPQLAESDSVQTNMCYLPVTSAANDYNINKRPFKVRKQTVRFQCSVYEKKLLQLKAKRSRLSVSEFCRRAVFKVEIKERLSDQHIEIYKTLVSYHNDLMFTGNTLGKSDPKLTEGVYQLANEIKALLQKIIK